MHRLAIDFPVPRDKASIHFQENQWLYGIGEEFGPQ
jgi:hypothetical protein